MFKMVFFINEKFPSFSYDTVNKINWTPTACTMLQYIMQNFFQVLILWWCHLKCKGVIFRSNRKRNLARIIYYWRWSLPWGSWSLGFKDFHLHRCLLRPCMHNVVLFYLKGPPKSGSFLVFYKIRKDESK